jgi:hypothetical protein
LVAVSQQAVGKVKQVKTDLIEKLKAQRVRLLQLHMEEGDSVSPDAFREERGRMQGEIAAAEESLAETEQRLTLDARMLRMALEIAEDADRVYAEASDKLKRSYNQAFFKKIKVIADRDEDTGELVVRVVGVELTDTYTVLTAETLVPGLRAEVEAFQSAPENGEDDLERSSSTGSDVALTPVSYFEVLAERVGFEPTRRVNPAHAISSRAP